MSHQYRVRNPEDVYFITFTIVDWVDVFTRPAYKQLIVDALNHCHENKGLEIYAYCLMTNHLHLLVSANHPAYLPDIIRDFKKFTSKQIVKLIEAENESRKEWILYRFEYHALFNTRVENYKVWQDGYHGIACDTVKVLVQKLNYIHKNPVRAGIVSEPEHYLYSSAVDYAGYNGMVKLTILDLGFTLQT